MGSTTDTAVVRAAGGVVHRTRKGSIEILMVHRPRYDDWSLPKGTLDDSESYPVAALREVEEETGFTGRLGATIGSIGYGTKRGPKVVRYWLVEAERGKFAPNSEVDEVTWVSQSKARKMASYTRDTNVLDRATQLLEDSRRSTVYLMRHANAGQRTKDVETDHERSLSKRGQRQVAQITRRFLRLPLTRIETSYFVRCEQTVEPLAAALDMVLGHEPTIVEGGPPEAVIQYFRSLHGEAALLSSHGDIISGVIGQLAAEGVEFDSPPVEWKKSSVWEVDLDKGKAIGGRYWPPPA
jgi:phosphohistidine phosphatase SixA/8-oxo-dGTP pyrophosphatase MutT (NUDIX family)